jgi:hypothetical protein
MQRLGLILAALIIAAGAWAVWSYRAAYIEIPAIEARLPSEEAFNAMSLGETEQALGAAMADCRRVHGFKWNPLARLLKGDEIASLSERCALIEARQSSLQGP